MKIKVIGGGGAFDDNNSSFLIETSPLSIEPSDTMKFLFDCNFQTFQYYKKFLKEIDFVFISHTHFDHIGGLEQLIFFRYFVQGKTTKILTGKKVAEDLEKILKNCNSAYVNGKSKDVKMFEILTEVKPEITIPINDIELVEGNHISVPNYGLLLKDNEYVEDKKALFISGDTKATKNIKDKLESLFKDGFSLTVFHDLSFWDDEENNIHCCPSELKRVYKGLYKNPQIRWFNYHNNEFDALQRNETIEIK